MSLFAFETDGAGSDRGSRFAPEPGRRDDALPEREWGLSAGQVAAVVTVILAVSEAIGLLVQH